MKLKPSLAAFTIGCVFAAPGQAGIVTHTADTSADPTYSRLQVVDASAPTVLAPNTAGANSVRYDTYSFSVATSGTYSFLTTGAFDSYQFLYSPSLNASQPLVGALIGNDDLFSKGNGGFAYALQAGVAYSLVTTGFADADHGFFSSTIGGPGAIAAAPDSGSGGDPTILTFTGDTTTRTTYNRVVADDLGTLSDTGTAVRYDARTFRVSVSGDYSFLTTGDFDTYSFLYQTFDPLHPTSGALAGNDDYFGGTSVFVRTLLAGIDYTFVTTGYDNAAFGAFSNTIGGPGAILSAATAVPEPEIPALLLAGCAMAACVSRRRGARAARV